MKTINEAELETSAVARYTYLADFMGFSEADIEVIHGAAAILAPLVPGLVDAVYDKLASYSSTWRHFMPRQHGYDGEIPASLEELNMDHPQIAFRKKHLGRYLVTLVTKPYDAKMVQYLDMVGKIHTPKAGSKDLDIPLVQMNALMGFVADAFIATIMGHEALSIDAKTAAVRAFSKLLWLQNDFITRHYAA